MIVKIEDSNIKNIIEYLNIKLNELSVERTLNGLTKRVFIDLKSDLITLNPNDAILPIELTGFSRINGFPYLNLNDHTIESFKGIRKKKINSFLDDNDKEPINKIILMLNDPIVHLVKDLVDNGTHR